MKPPYRRLALAVCLLPLAACSGGPSLPAPYGSSASSNTSTGMSSNASSLSVADQSFLTQAAYGGFGEVALGELAARRAASPAVRDFGQRMVDEHGAANRELAQLAQSKGATPPMAPDPGRQAVASSLATLDGTAFDRQYISQQRSEHDVAIALFEAESRDGSDVDLRDFARRALPTLRSHQAQLTTLSSTAVSVNP